jgi:hypothetical protein
MPATAAPPQGYFELKPGVTLKSGDSWEDRGQHFRLFGVQACLRGTFYVDKASARRDCGDSSLAVFAAYISDTTPLCAHVARSEETVFASCYATIGADRLDLANLMISSGFAFASLDEYGLPIMRPMLWLSRPPGKRRSVSGNSKMSRIRRSCSARNRTAEGIRDDVSYRQVGLSCTADDRPALPGSFGGYPARSETILCRARIGSLPGPGNKSLWPGICHRWANALVSYGTAQGTARID